MGHGEVKTTRTGSHRPTVEIDRKPTDIPAKVPQAQQKYVGTESLSPDFISIGPKLQVPGPLRQEFSQLKTKALQEFVSWKDIQNEQDHFRGLPKEAQLLHLILCYWDATKKQYGSNSGGSDPSAGG